VAFLFLLSMGLIFSSAVRELPSQPSSNFSTLKFMSHQIYCSATDRLGVHYTRNVNFTITRKVLVTCRQHKRQALVMLCFPQSAFHSHDVPLVSEAGTRNVMLPAERIPFGSNMIPAYSSSVFFFFGGYGYW
jgi:hypothetical protein